MKRLLLAAAIPFLLGSSCPGSDDPAGPNGDAVVVGNWTLQTLNGDPLPAPWSDNGETFTVTAGSLVVNANGTFTFTETMTGEPLDQTSGAWNSASGTNTFTLVPSAQTGEEQHNGTAVVSGNTLTLTIEGGSDVRVYQRS